MASHYWKIYTNPVSNPAFKSSVQKIRLSHLLSNSIAEKLNSFSYWAVLCYLDWANAQWLGGWKSYMVDLAMPLKDWTVCDIREYHSSNSNNIFAFSFSSQIPSSLPFLDSLPLSTKHVAGVSHLHPDTSPSRYLGLNLPTRLRGRGFWPDVWRSQSVFILGRTTMVHPPAHSKSALLSSTTPWFPRRQTKVNKCFILPCAFS